ncbi:MAG: winged helix-turn-helix domain-containing protein [Novosphingobium sp.]
MTFEGVAAKTVQDLAAMTGFALGAALVRPSLLSIERNGRTIKLEPRVMLLLVAMHEAGEGPLTRDALIDRCWGGLIVTDDAIGRAISKLRSAGHELDDPFRVETVAKLGYRLIVEAEAEPMPLRPDTGGVPFSRRRVLGAFAATAGLAALGVAGWRARQPDPALGMIEEAGVALKQGLPETNARALALLQQAVKLRPDDALAWGRLAIAWRGVVEFGSAAETAPAVANAELAAKRALALDPHQSEGLAAVVTLTSGFGDWGPTEHRIREVLRADPANYFANAALAKFYMSTGQVRLSEQVNRQLIERDPLSPDRQFREIYLLWSLGRRNEMDMVAERALALWPLHPGVWFARFWTLLYTGRAPAALAMLDKTAAMPPIPAPALALFRLSIAAIEGTANREAAIAANRAAARRGPQLATAAVMFLSRLGDLDGAFAIANAHLLSRDMQGFESRHTAAQASVPDLFHRMTMFLFTPDMADFRADARFAQLCTGIGLTAYWQATDVVPDFRIA